MTDDRNDTGPRRRLGLPGQLRPGEQLETVFRDELPDPADAALPGYPLTRVESGPATEDDAPRSGPEGTAETSGPAPAAPPPPGPPAPAPGPTEPQAAADHRPSAWASGDVPRADLGGPVAGSGPEESFAPPRVSAPAPRPSVPERAAAEHGAPPRGTGDVPRAEPRGPVAGARPEELSAPPRVPAPSRGSGGPDGHAAIPGPSTAKAEPVPEVAPEVPLRAALEAVLMVVDEPVTVARLADVLERPKKIVAEALAGLAAEYDAQERGFELRFVAGGWRFYTRAVCAPVVDRFVLDGQQSRLTQAALETLAVIAYRQPVSRSRVSAVRGVNCDGVMRTLVQRGLVEESGSEPETGAFLYRTTHHFLERMGLRGLDELPELAPFLPEAGDVEADSQEGSAITEAIAEAVAVAD